jgi:mycothiol maleylpyruvate isomerase-like protein
VPRRSPRDDLVYRVDEAWRPFAADMARLSHEAYERPTAAGWSVGGMLAHICAWHEATAYRLHRFGATGHPQPKVVEDDDAFNARVIAETAGRHAELIRADVHASFERLRAAILALDPELDPKGWVEAVVAGNTYEHYEEHRAELRAAIGVEA